ncbi:gag-polypeptide of LTR copia-type domain-containing protein [Phthorimaea operculella]|nr:gag-polypeptide of LTR copia-type domain-containing protein [Phthorimaea operculella]
MEKAIAETSKVQIMHLNGTNYKHWRYRIETVCRAIPKAEEILAGKLRKPVEPTTIEGGVTDDAAVAQYQKDLQQYLSIDSAVLTLMTTNMTDEILDHVMRYKSAKEVWDELERLYSGSSEDKSYDLCLKFFEYKKDPEHDIRKHISMLKNIWHELNGQLDTNLPEILLICKILGTLPRDYFAFKSSWLLITKKDRTIDNLTSQLSAYEKALTTNKSTENTEEVLTVQTGKKKKGFKSFKCKYCGQVGHAIRKCQKWINDGRPPKPSNDDRKQKTNVNMTKYKRESMYPPESPIPT